MPSDRILELLDSLSSDEGAVVVLMAERLRQGPVDIAGARRDW